MNLVGYTATALSRNDIEDTPTNKNVVDFAIVELKDLNGDLVVIYDDAEGANPETQKTCDTNGQVTFFAEIGDYDLEINGKAQRINLSSGLAEFISTKTDESVQQFIDSFALKIFQSPTDGGLTEIQTRTVDAGEVYEVRKTSDNSLATIYSDAAGTAEIVQNGTDNKSGSDGVVEFYVGEGEYYVDVGGVRANFKSFSHSLLLDLNAGGGHDAIYDRSFDTVSTMIAYSDHKIGNRYSTGGTSWQCLSASPSSIADFKKLTNSDEALTDLTIFPYDESVTLENGDIVPSGTTALRIFKSVWVLIAPRPFVTGWDRTTLGGVVSGINLGTRTVFIGGQEFEIGEAAYNVVDKLDTSTSSINLEHYSNGSGSYNFSTYGLDIHNNVGAQSAAVIHQYSKNGPAVQIDNTDNAPSILINNTVNPTRNPSGPALYGEGDYFKFARNGVTKLSLDDNFVWRPVEGLPFDVVAGTGTPAIRAQTGAGNTQTTLETRRGEAAGYAYRANDGNGNLKFGIRGDGKIVYTASGNIQGTVGGSGAASPLPASPEIYIKMFVDGVEYVIPAFKVN